MGKLTGMVNKIISPLDKYGELIGAAGVAYSKRVHLIMEFRKIAQGHIHFPNVNSVVSNLVNEPLFQQGVTAAIGGYILKSVGINPTLSRIGSVAQKIGTGMAITQAVENVLGYATNPGYPGAAGAASFMSQAPRYDYLEAV